MCVGEVCCILIAHLLLHTSSGVDAACVLSFLPRNSHWFIIKHWGRRILTATTSRMYVFSGACVMALHNMYVLQ